MSDKFAQRALRRVLAALGLSLWLVASSLLPPEHVHEAGADDHPHSPVVHRHFSPHEQTAAGTPVPGHAAATVDDPDEQVVWLDSSALVESRYTLPPDVVDVPARVTVLFRALAYVRIGVAEATLPHGPPRDRPLLRGPPLRPS